MDYGVYSQNTTPDKGNVGYPYIEYQDIYNKDGFYIVANLPGTSAATAGNYGLVFTSLVTCELIAVAETHEVKGTDAGSVTLQIEKLTGTQAPGSGVNMLATAIDLKGAINTPQYPPLTLTKANRVLNVTLTSGTLSSSDRIALKKSGTLTAVAGVTVTLYMHRYGKGHYN